MLEETGGTREEETLETGLVDRFENRIREEIVNKFEQGIRNPTLKKAAKRVGEMVKRREGRLEREDLYHSLAEVGLPTESSSIGSALEEDIGNRVAKEMRLLVKDGQGGWCGGRFIFYSRKKRVCFTITPYDQLELQWLQLADKSSIFREIVSSGFKQVRVSGKKKEVRAENSNETLFGLLYGIENRQRQFDDYSLDRDLKNVSNDALVAYLVYKELGEPRTYAVSEFRGRGLGIYHAFGAYIHGGNPEKNFSRLVSAKFPMELAGFTGRSNPNAKNDDYTPVYLEFTDDTEIVYIGNGDVYSYFMPTGERVPSRGFAVSRNIEEVKLGDVREVFIKIRELSQIKTCHVVGTSPDVFRDAARRFGVPIVEHREESPNRYYQIKDAIHDVDYCDIYADGYYQPEYPLYEQGMNKLDKLGISIHEARDYLRDRVSEMNENYYLVNERK